MPDGTAPLLDPVEYPAHPAAECFRLMNDEELESLVASIATHGLRDPITLGIVGVDEQPYVADGRNRLRACRIAKIEPRFETIAFADKDELIAFVETRNERRDITKGERAMSIAMLYPSGGKPAPGRTDPAATAAETAAVSMRRIQQARQILHASAELAVAVRDGVRKLDDALETVRREQLALNSDTGKATRLRAEAPDLADLVSEDRMNLAEATAALNARVATRDSAISMGRRHAEDIASEFALAVSGIRGALGYGDLKEILARLDSSAALNAIKDSLAELRTALSTAKAAAKKGPKNG